MSHERGIALVLFLIGTAFGISAIFLPHDAITFFGAGTGVFVTWVTALMILARAKATKQTMENNYDR